MEVSDIDVDVPLLMSHPKSALLGVLQLLEGWQSVIEDDITVEQFSGAMTNMVYRCGLLQGGKEVQVVLMRVHASSSELFDRQAEIETFKAVSQAGLGPHLLLLFRNGRVEEFLSEHVTLAAADIHDPAVSTAIAATLATFHQKMSKVMAGSKDPAGAVQLWQRLRLWLDLAQQATSLSELQQLGMAGLEQEITALQQQLTQQHPCWVALCHNDLQYGNIMVHVGAAAASADGAPAPAAAAAASADGSSTGGSLAQQLQGLGLQDRPAAAAATGADELGPGVSPRQQLLQPAGAAAAATPAAAAAGGSMLAAGLSARQAAPESWASDDVASLSNVSVAGSTAPSVSGLSAESVPNATAATPLPAGTAPTTAVNVAAAAQPKPADRTASSSSLQVLGRSPHRTVQLPDGSLVLPGMRARPRGQSPEPSRGKRPDPSGISFTGSLGGISTQGSGQWSSATAGEGRSVSVTSGAAAAAGSAAGAMAVPQLQPPSAAAVLRHAGSSDGDLLLQLVPDDPEAVAEAGMTRRRRISHADSVSAANRRGGSGAGSGNVSDSESSSSSSSSATTSAADSAEAEDLLLVPQHLQRQRAQQQQQPGRESAAGELVAERAAAVSRSARRYRQVRRARRRPEEGLEFPTLITSDAGSDSYSDDSSDLGGDSPSGSPSARQSRGRSPPSRFSKPASAAGMADAAAAAGAAAPLSPVAAAVSAAACSADGGPDGSGSCVTFIDYEYSGFNPVAFDIANHWCEWAADYHTEEPHVLDFSRLPDPQQQLLFVECYLRALLGKLGIQVPAGSSAAAGGRDSNTGAAAAASPEPDNLSSLAGYKLTPGMNSSSRSEAAWSTLSSRGAGSVLSYPDTESNWETASQSSVVTTRSNRTDMEDGPAPPPPAAAAAAAAPAGADGSGRGSTAAAVTAASSAQPGPSSSDLHDIWCWLEHAAGVSSSGGSGSRQLGAAAWQQLVFKVVAAADAYMAASHLQWALWGVIQAKVSDVDFDFMGYGQQRWRMYLQTRPTALRK